MAVSSREGEEGHLRLLLGKIIKTAAARKLLAAAFFIHLVHGSVVFKFISYMYGVYVFKKNNQKDLQNIEKYGILYP